MFGLKCRNQKKNFVRRERKMQKREMKKMAKIQISFLKMEKEKEKEKAIIRIMTTTIIMQKRRTLWIMIANGTLLIGMSTLCMYANIPELLMDFCNFSIFRCTVEQIPC